jgi:hypothetical protein
MGRLLIAPSTGTTGISRQFSLQFHLAEAYVFCTPTSRLAALPFLISYHIVSIEFFLLFATLFFGCIQKLSLRARLFVAAAPRFD